MYISSLGRSQVESPSIHCCLMMMVGSLIFRLTSKRGPSYGQYMYVECELRSR